MCLGALLLHLGFFARIAIVGEEIVVGGIVFVELMELRLVQACWADFYGITVQFRGGRAESRIGTRFLAPWTTRADDICQEIMRRSDQARKA